MKSIARVWRKSRIAALILRRETTGRLTPRDIRIGRALGEDASVTPRLIAQAMKGYELRDIRLGRTGRPLAQNRCLTIKQRSPSHQLFSRIG